MERRGGETLGLVLAWLTLVWWLVYRDSGLWAVMVKCEVMAGDDKKKNVENFLSLLGEGIDQGGFGNF